MTSVLPGPNNFNIEIGGEGGKVEAHFVQQAFLFPTPEPYQQKNEKLGEEGKGKPSTTQSRKQQERV